MPEPEIPPDSATPIKDPVTVPLGASANRRLTPREAALEGTRRARRAMTEQLARMLRGEKVRQQ